MDSKLPTKFLFLGISANDKNGAQRQVVDYIHKIANILIESYPANVAYQNFLGNFEKEYNFPQSHHITTFFNNKKLKSIQQSQYIDGFQKNISMDIKVHGVAIYLDHIITGICTAEDYSVPIQNQYPHLTMMIKQWQPKQSNELLEKLFQCEPDLEEKVLKSSEEFLRLVEVPGFQSKVIVAKLSQPLLIQAQTKVY